MSADTQLFVIFLIACASAGVLLGIFVRNGFHVVCIAVFTGSVLGLLYEAAK